MQAVGDLQRAHPGRDIAVLVPELVVSRWYHYILHNQTAALIKAYLLFSGYRRVVVINVPWYLSSAPAEFTVAEPVQRPLIESASSPSVEANAPTP
jgi:hypothetical protein